MLRKLYDFFLGCLIYRYVYFVMNNGYRKSKGPLDSTAELSLNTMAVGFSKIYA